MNSLWSKNSPPMPLSNEKGHTLSDLYSDLFALANHLKVSKAGGDPQMVRAHLITLLNRVDGEAKHLGIPEETQRQARYAVVAFIDEMILCSPCAYRDWWSDHKLQQELFNEDAAGVGFFSRLEAIRSSHPVSLDMLEVYYLCLVLGFEGQYKIHRREQLKALVEGIAQQLKTKGPGTLSPHGQRPDELVADVSAGLPSWVVITITAGIIFLFYVGLSFIIGHRADNARVEIQEKMQEDEMKNRQTIRRGR